jgi:ketosteroid isomerase-like protein
MTTRLPAAVSGYFDAAERDDVDALLVCFATDAVVFDEDAEWRGRAGIRRWRETVATKYDYTLEVLGAEVRAEPDEPERTDVHAHLEGNFPGGTVDLDYRFTLGENLIRKLEIVPTATA